MSERALIARLRNRNTFGPDDFPLLHEAADAIERLADALASVSAPEAEPRAPGAAEGEHAANERAEMFRTEALAANRAAQILTGAVAHARAWFLDEEQIGMYDVMGDALDAAAAALGSAEREGVCERNAA